MFCHDAIQLSQDVIVVKYHNTELGRSQYVYKIGTMADEEKYPFWEQGRRLRWLRQAEKIPSGVAFARKFDWPQSGYSQFETGARQIPRDKAMQLRAQIAGFDPLYLWEDDRRGLSYDLRTRIEAEEAKESGAEESVRRKR